MSQTKAVAFDAPPAVGAGNPLRQRSVLAKRYAIYLALSAVVVLLTAHVFVFQTDWSRSGSFADMAKTAAWFLPNLAYFPDILLALFETFLIAFWGTTIGMVIAVPVAVLAAHNVSPFGVVSYWAGRLVIVFSRSVHELIFALIFVSALGLGALPGMLALAVRSVGFLAKTTAEAIENVDIGPIEAIEATGARRLAVILFAVVPQVFPIFIGNVIFQFDINLRRASILGMVGGGGIGLIFAEQIMSLAYDKAGTVVLGIVMMVLVGEYVSNRVREWLL
ncbi:MAG: phosphonate ABC transporter, permease protein PhnE [Alphaproteobacteria bacterium]|jgi:phosphonate transport system permease protein|nr:phosphonate ABC transporter, permease protein PhnE [Alphaproteobacteria bacterium]